MISLLVSLLIAFLNPFKQIQKARDAQREQNLKQLNAALDSYYNDVNCYPASFSFGGTWQQGAVSYMQKVPQDPDCASGGSCFFYVSDTTSACPQWNVIFAKIQNEENLSSASALEQMSSCLPSNYADSGYNFFLLSREVDCSYINSITLPANAGAGTGRGTGGSGGGGSCSKDYACTGNPVHCNIISPAGSGTYCNSNCDGVCR